MSKTGIVILGCPRSGTTLLRRLLGAHPSIAAAGETYLLSACARFLKEQPAVGGVNVGVLNGLGFLGHSEEETLARLREFAFGFLSEHAQREGKPRWLEKTAIDAFHLREIERLCSGHVRFVCIVRHGLDVACSMMDWAVKAQAVPDEIHDYLKQTPNLIEAFSRAWADSTHSICDFCARHPESAILLRYEDLVANPEDTLRTILASLGENYDPDLLDAALKERDPKGFSDWKTFSASAVTVCNVDRWRSLPSETVGMVAEIVNPVLLRNGYNSVPETAAQAQEKARKRYLIGLLLQTMR